MIEGTTKAGFSFALDDDALDDMELLDGLIELDKGNVSGLADTMKALLGDEQKTRLYEFCRTEKGRVSARKVFAEVREIFNVASNLSKQVKN